MQLMFTYTSLLSPATSSGVIGQIIMTTDYNAADSPFTSTNEMLNNIGTISARPTDGPVMHGVECDPNKNVNGSLFVRVGEVPAGQDIKTYDQGTFQLATEGMPLNDQLQGQLWVSYAVKLRKPKLFTSVGKSQHNDVFKGFGGASGNMLGKELYASPSNMIGTSIIQSYNGTGQRVVVQFPQTVVQGYYIIQISVEDPKVGGIFPGVPFPTVTFSNMTTPIEVKYAYGYPSSFEAAQSTSISGVAPHINVVQYIKLDGSFSVPTYCQFDFNGLGSTLTTNRSQVNVIQINPSFVANTNVDVPVGWIPQA